MTDAGELLVRRFGRDRVRRDAALAPFTTFRVGGPADWLIETRNSDEVVTALRLAHAAGMPVTVLGGGSNVLVSDAGVRGLVIRTRGGVVQQIAPGLVRADAAVSINGLVRWTIHHGCAGLEAWAGTPGTVGGAMFGNAHFAGRLIGDLVESVSVASRDGVVADLAGAEMAFGYDRSRLQLTGEVLLSAVFRVERRGAGGAAGRRARVARLPQSEPSRSTRATRAACFKTPNRRATVCPRDSLVGRCAGRPGRAEGRGDRRARGYRRRTATSS